MMTAREQLNATIKLSVQMFKKNKIKCDCGGPEMGTSHSPDCAYVLASEDCWHEAKLKMAEKLV